MNRNRYFLLFFVVFGIECSGDATTPSNLPKACELLTQADAAKILGQPARQTQDSSEIEDGIRRVRCAYTAVQKVNGREFSLFFGLDQKEKNPTIEQAHEMFQSTKKANEKDSVLEDIKGIGDEAYFHSVPPNFHFLMVREDETIILFKINKVPQTASLDELKAFAKRVAEKL